MAPSWTIFYFYNLRLENDSSNITLEERASIAGTVSDEAGKPIAGAEVTADACLPPHNDRQQRIAGGPPLDWLRTKTDAQGAFTIKDLPKTSSIDLHVTAPGKGGLYLDAPAEPAGLYKAGDTNIRVTLQPEARIRGIVVDADTRKPLAGVPVLIEATSPAETDPQVRLTGPDGAFEAFGLPAADYSISLARLPGQLDAAFAEPLAVNNVRTGEIRSGVVLLTAPDGLLEIVLTNEKKEPISGARVWLQARPQGNIEQIPGLSDKDGIISIRLKPGAYQVSQIEHEIYSQQFRDAADTLDAQKGRTLRVALTVAEKPHASGIVLDPQGKPVAGAKVTVMPFGGGPEEVTDEDGKFTVRWRTIKRRNDITACLLVRAPEADLAGVLPLEDKGQMDNLKITLAPGITITGTVVAPDNRPISKANVAVILQRNHYGSYLREDSDTIGQDGKYAIRALPDGQKYQFQATAPDFGRNQVPVDLSTAKDRVVTVPPVVLKRANLTVTGIVVDEDDKPVSGASVSAGGMEQNVMAVQSDKDGKFTLKNLCDARAMIQTNKRAADGSNQIGRIEFSRNVKEVKIVLGEMSLGQGAVAVRASGVVLDPQGRPVAGATVQVWPNQGMFAGNARKTDEGGKFKVSWQKWPNQNMQYSLLVIRPRRDSPLCSRWRTRTSRTISKSHCRPVSRSPARSWTRTTAQSQKRRSGSCSSKTAS